MYCSFKVEQQFDFIISFDISKKLVKHNKPIPYIDEYISARLGKSYDRDRSFTNTNILSKIVKTR